MKTMSADGILIKSKRSFVDNNYRVSFLMDWYGLNEKRARSIVLEFEHLVYSDKELAINEFKRIVKDHQKFLRKEIEQKSKGLYL